MQPVGKDWELILFDRIGDDLCYAHVGYPNENEYCHEVLAFLKMQVRMEAYSHFAGRNRY